ncbi:very short patch repair endonuclease [Flavobacterium sp. DG1-102-2]|uniref:very short patch repair endonuclease n=1 Tax=Flavobacterium sp. DG1-102-2 TaxID=3081663 RepID=UPI002948D7BD|nr:very short patch repair endonuclease [Flavobacterium sp. DG1-102-2]MDV6169507.1 very short patch repair endonuclease [Flavobacterium sp. DG1-102-2]
MDKFSKEKRSFIMSRIKGKDTKDEKLLAKALWARGHRYRKNNKKVFGTPDLTFRKHKIAIFVDGEFFHGYNWHERRDKIQSNRDYWIPKIERNMQRDRDVNHFLLENGWRVIRFWGSFIKKNLAECIAIIEAEINSVSSVS